MKYLGWMPKAVGAFLLILLGFHCNKSTIRASPYQNLGIILGNNEKTCPCAILCPCECGGIYFQFTDSLLNQNVVVVNPDVFNLPKNPPFPIRVKVDWQNATHCSVVAIRVTSFEVY